MVNKVQLFQFIPCSPCKGKGEVMIYQDESRWDNCSECDGTGLVVEPFDIEGWHRTQHLQNVHHFTDMVN